MDNISFAVGGSAITSLDVPANEYERFSDVVYDSVIEQSKVESLIKESTYTENLSLMICHTLL